jgi:hypothetical protein
MMDVVASVCLVCSDDFDVSEACQLEEDKMSKLGSIASICVLSLAALFPIGIGRSATPPWSLEQDADLGFRYAYPRTLFSEIEGDGKPAFHYFVSHDSDAKFLVGAWDNREGKTPNEFKRWLVTNAGGYEEVTYRPRGRSWFVLSGYRGDDIYYEKVMFSCRGRVVNVMAITYPTAQRDRYDPVVERMEDTFKPGRPCS